MMARRPVPPKDRKTGDKRPAERQEGKAPTADARPTGVKKPTQAQRPGASRPQGGARAGAGGRKPADAQAGLTKPQTDVAQGKAPEKTPGPDGDGPRKDDAPKGPTGSRPTAGAAPPDIGRPTSKRPAPGVDPDGLFSALRNDLPMLLAPVRIETRFAGPPDPRLRIRIFPDPALICSFDEALSDAETRAGTAFWKAIRAADGNRDAHMDAWRGLTADIAAQRAAWIATATRPGSGDRKDRIAGAITPARAAWLPARWLAVGYVGGERVLLAQSRLVRADLAFSVEPTDLDPAAAGLRPGAEGAWLFDFDLALEAGMAIEADLPPEAAGGLDRLFVIGAPEADDATGPSPLAALLVDALFGRGAGFAPQGAPTSNTADSDSAWTPLAADKDGEFARHFPDLAPEALTAAPRIRGALTTAAPAANNAAVLRNALGLRGDPLDRFVYAAGAEDAAMRAMNVALWPVTWGRYMSDLLLGEGPDFFSAADISWVRDFFVGHVRGGAALPALRLGESPFGFALCLPEDGDADPRRAQLRALIARLRSHWTEAAKKLPRLADASPGAKGNPGEIVFELLSLSPHPATFETRHLRDVDWGINFVYDTYAFGVFDLQDAPNPNQVAPHNVDYLAGDLKWSQRSARTPAEQRAAFRTVHQRLAPFDIRIQPGEEEPPANQIEETPLGERFATFRPWRNEEDALWLYIAEHRFGPRPPDGDGAFGGWQIEQAMWDTQAERFVPRGDVLRQVFIAIADILGICEKAVDHLEEHAARNRVFRLAAAPAALFRGTMGEGHQDPPIAFGAYSPEANAFPSDALVTVGRGEDAVAPADYLGYERRRILNLLGRGPAPGADPFADARRSPLLPHLLHEAVTRASYRIDEAAGRREMEELGEAIGTLAALPADELELLLRQTLGLAGWRLDAWATALASQRLAKMREKRRTGLLLGHFGYVEDLRPASAAPDARREGYVHTPSLTHARTAAVLRAGWRARGEGPASDPLAVDLGSGRMRAAAWCFDAVRQGADLGEVLGYRFERRLADAGEQVWIDPVRRAVLEITGDPPDRADPVVDGLDLAAIWAGGAGRPQLAGKMTFADGEKVPGIDRIVPALKELEATLDAMADAALADATHALVQGDAGRAGATLGAISTGATPPPRLDVLNSPEIGTLVSTSVCLLTTPGAAQPWGDGGTPRALADPLAEALAQAALGPAGDIAFRVDIARVGAATETIDATLADLRSSAEWRLSALDTLAMLGDGETSGSPLARWIARWAEDIHPGATNARLCADDPAQADVFLRLRAWRDVLLRGRPLAPRDFPEPAEGVAEESNSAAAAAALAARVDATRGGYEAAVAALATTLPEPTEETPEPVDGIAPAPVAAALRALARYGHPDALATTAERGDGAAIGAKAWATLAAARKRRSQLPGAPAEAEPDVRIRRAHAALRHVFGPSVPGCVPLRPASTDSLGSAFARSDRRLARHPEQPLDWVDRIGLARPDIGRLSEALMVDAALGLPLPAIGVGQLPDDDAGWCAVTAPGDGRQRHAVLAMQPGGTGPIAPGAEGFAGLAIDTVTDRIPALRRDTGVALEIETPNAEAPQCFALCLTPRGAEWSLDLAVECIDDMIRWAKVRAVDGAVLDSFDQHLPAVFAAASLTDELEAAR